MSSSSCDAEIARAVQALRAGDVIGLPTETVYGLAADASNVAAVEKIFRLKGRPADHPLIVHIADALQLPRWTSTSSDRARALAAAFWPGPLTLILPRHADVPTVVTGGQDTVGLRCPAHPMALALLRAFGGGLAAPSANRFGRISPTTAAHVREEFGDSVPLVLDGGDCEVGIESTIVDLSGGVARVLRPGAIGIEQMRAVIGSVEDHGLAQSPRAPGTLAAHYAPRTALQLLPLEAMQTVLPALNSGGGRAVVLALGKLPAGTNGLVLPDNPAGYAHGLYAAMRKLDASGADLLLVQAPPEGAAWLAVRDRLQRAAAGAGVFDEAP